MLVLYALVYNFTLPCSEIYNLITYFREYVECIVVSFGIINLSDSNLTTYYQSSEYRFIPLGKVKYLMVLEIATGDLY